VLEGYWQFVECLEYASIIALNPFERWRWMSTQNRIVDRARGLGHVSLRDERSV
jgi:hypothetical protein